MNIGVFHELSWRGFIHQVTYNELAELLNRDRFTVYCGFDPTADSLHIGHLLAIMGLAHFQRAGHRPIALVGGATGMIGDPSFKAEERRLLTRKEVDANAEAIGKQLERFLDFSGPNAAILVNNAEWLYGLSLIDFLRDMGKHFSVNVLIAKESIRARLEDREHGISFTEFSYVLLQAYDFLHMYDTYDCKLQVGGSDQWGNIVAGMDLIRRLRNDEAYGLTFPLVTKADGTKFGKTESGNVWLSPVWTSPYRFYQFWINQTDADTPRWLRCYTFLDRDEIAELEREIAARPEQRSAQRVLAREVTRLVHGDTALQNAVRASEAIFGGDLKGLDDTTLEEVFCEVSSTLFDRAVLAQEKLLVDVLVEAGVFASKGEARRLVQNGGLYLNNERVASADARLTEQSLCSQHIAVVRTGKKHYHLLKFA